jgi:ketosteroid isomerase-like protein
MVAHLQQEIVRRSYAALNAGDLNGFLEEFAEDIVWHGSGTEVRGREAVGAMVGELVRAAGGTLHIDLHDVLASDAHVVALQVTRAERAGQRLADRVVYVFHVRDGKVAEAWFTGDPRIQEEFWS